MISVASRPGALSVCNPGSGRARSGCPGGGSSLRCRAVGPLRVKGQPRAICRPLARPAMADQGSKVILDDRPAGRQPKTGDLAARLGREDRIEDPRLICGWGTGVLIDHPQDEARTKNAMAKLSSGCVELA